MRNRWAWEKGGDGFTPAERRVHDALRQTREDLLSGRQAAQASRERISKNIQEATAQLERMQASSAIAARQVSAEISEGITAVANGLARLGGKIDALSDLIDIRLSELIQAVDSGFGRVCLQLAEINVQLGRIIELLENPNRTDCAELTRTGMLLYHHVEWDKAKKRFELAVSKFESFPAPWLYLGKIALYVDGDLVSADALFAEATIYGKLQAADIHIAADALIERANIAFLNGDKLKCVDFAKQAIDLRRDDVAILVHAARCFVAANELRSAERSLIAAFNIEPRTVVALALPWTEPVHQSLSQWLKRIHQEDYLLISALGAEFRAIVNAAIKLKLHEFRKRSFDVTEKLLGRMGEGFLDLRINAKDYLDLLKLVSQGICQDMRESIHSTRSAYEKYQYDGIRISVNAFLFWTFFGLMVLNSGLNSEDQNVVFIAIFFLMALILAFFGGRFEAAAKKGKLRRTADRVRNDLDPLIVKLLELSGPKAAQVESVLSQRSHERLTSTRYSDKVWVKRRLLPKAFLSFLRVGR